MFSDWGRFYQDVEATHQLKNRKENENPRNVTGLSSGLGRFDGLARPPAETVFVAAQPPFKNRKQKKMNKKKKQQKQRFSQKTMELCHDCKLPIFWKENYIVRPDVWKAAKMMPKGGCLHLDCLEARIGRKLETADFLVVYGGERKTDTGMMLTVLDLNAYLKFNVAMGY